MQPTEGGSVDLKVSEDADRGLWVVVLVAPPGRQSLVCPDQYDPSGHTQHPGGRRDSIPPSLEP